ncbi:hypothetical protein MMC07_006431 [Pseudocyphellaria aurata]|nr:hypothetical protein [Pseudocyphellaria aurata]
MSSILPIFLGSRLLVGALIAIVPHFSASLLLLPTSRAFILPFRACGVREFVLGGLLYSARHPDDAYQRQALLAGAATDALDVVFTVATWVLGEVDGAPAAIIAGSPTASDGSVLSSETKPILLTLHCLFPSDLLPALDLLDRRLVTQFELENIASPDPCGSEEAPTRQGKAEGRAAVYYVRSSQRSRYSRATAEASGTSYEVRLQAWNCTCPAFAFAAFGPQDEDAQVDSGNDDEDDGRKDVRMEDTFGGLALREREVPVCKHLLACLLVEMGGSLGEFANQRVVGREEMAGWAAGWGG